jgi:hypothetical protein
MQIIDATTPEQFQQLLAEHPRVLVDFHKDQCPGCRMLEMSLHRVANSVAGQGTPCCACSWRCWARRSSGTGAAADADAVAVP